MTYHEACRPHLTCLLLSFSCVWITLTSTVSCPADERATAQSTKATVESLVEQWKIAEEAKDYDRAESVAGSIVAMRRKAVPSLTTLLSARRDYATRYCAVVCLYHIGPEASDAVPALIKATGDNHPTVRCLAMRALAEITPGWSAEHVPLLTKLLEDENSVVSSEAALFLGYAGAAGKSALAAMIDVMQDKRRDMSTRSSCARSLPLIDSDSPRVAQALIRALADEGFFGWAMTPLGMCGANAKPAVPFLVKVLKRADSSSPEAAETLGEIGPEAKDAVPALIASIDGDRLSLAEISIESLVQIDPASADTLAVLVRVVSAKDASLGVYAAEGLGRIGPPARVAIPSLIEALKQQTTRNARRAAAEALGRIGTARDREIVSALQSAMHDDDTRLASARALVRLGIVSDQVVAALIQSLKVDNVSVSTFKTLGEIGPKAKDSTPTLIEMMTESDTLNRMYAAETLGRIGGTTDAVRDCLLKAIRDEKASVRVIAAEALCHTGLDSQKGVETLISVLKVGHFDSSWCALEALGRIGPVTPDVLPALSQALNDEQPFTRIDAAKALGDIGPPAKTEIPALTKALKDRNPLVRAAALEALEKIAEGR